MTVFSSILNIREISVTLPPGECRLPEGTARLEGADGLQVHLVDHGFDGQIEAGRSSNSSQPKETLTSLKAQEAYREVWQLERDRYLSQLESFRNSYRQFAGLESFTVTGHYDKQGTESELVLQLSPDDYAKVLATFTPTTSKEESVEKSAEELARFLTGTSIKDPIAVRLINDLVKMEDGVRTLALAISQMTSVNEMCDWLLTIENGAYAARVVLWMNEINSGGGDALLQALTGYATPAHAGRGEQIVMFASGVGFNVAQRFKDPIGIVYQDRLLSELAAVEEAARQAGASDTATDKALEALEGKLQELYDNGIIADWTLEFNNGTSSNYGLFKRVHIEFVDPTAAHETGSAGSPVPISFEYGLTQADQSTAIEMIRDGFRRFAGSSTESLTRQKVFDTIIRTMQDPELRRLVESEAASLRWKPITIGENQFYFALEENSDGIVVTAHFSEEAGEPVLAVRHVQAGSGNGFSGMQQFQIIASMGGDGVTTFYGGLAEVDFATQTASITIKRHNPKAENGFETVALIPSIPLQTAEGNDKWEILMWVQRLLLSRMGQIQE